MLNFSDVDARFSLKEKVNGEFIEVFSAQPGTFSPDQDIHMKPWEYLVFEKQDPSLQMKFAK